MKTLPIISWQKVFSKWILLLIVGFSGCDGKFYTVEKLSLPQQTRVAEVVKESSPEWSYPGKNKAENWASLATEYSPCADGKRQSPVNFLSVKPVTNHQVRLSYRPSYENILNNGHTIELIYDKGSHIEFDGKSYNLTQFHFHTPGEHLIHRKRYPMEMHLVHRSEDTTYLVIGVLFEEGRENRFLSRFANYIPQKPSQKEVENNIQVGTLFPEQKHFYHYQGSFTTPPCTQGVRWLVLKQTQQASAEQIQTIAQIEGNNARHTQRLNHREVEIF
jgi:carbonic anhydrase